MQAPQDYNENARQSIQILKRVRTEFLQLKDDYEQKEFEMQEKSVDGGDVTGMAQELLVLSNKLIKSKKRFRAALRETREAVKLFERNLTSPDAEETFRRLLQELEFLEPIEAPDHGDVLCGRPTRQGIPVVSRQSVHFQKHRPSVLPRIPVLPARVQSKVSQPSQSNLLSVAPPSRRPIRRPGIPALIPDSRLMRAPVASQFQSQLQRSEVPQLSSQPSASPSAINVSQKISQHRERMAQTRTKLNRSSSRTSLGSIDGDLRNIQIRKVWRENAIQKANDIQRRNMRRPQSSPAPWRSRANEDSLSQTVTNQSNVSRLQRIMQPQSTPRPSTTPVRSQSPYLSSPTAPSRLTRVEQLKTGDYSIPRSPTRAVTSTSTQRPVSPLARLSTTDNSRLPRGLSPSRIEVPRMCCDRSPRALTARPPIPLDGSDSRPPSPWLNQPSRGLSPPSRSRMLELTRTPPLRSRSPSHPSTSVHPQSPLGSRPAESTSQSVAGEGAAQIPRSLISRFPMPGSRIPGSRIGSRLPVGDSRIAGPSGITNIPGVSRIPAGASKIAGPSGVSRIPKCGSRMPVPSTWVDKYGQQPIQEMKHSTPPKVVASKLKTSVRVADNATPRQINSNRSRRSVVAQKEKTPKQPPTIVPFIFSPGMEVPHYVIERDILYVANQLVGIDPEDLPVENSKLVRAIIQTAKHFKMQMMTKEEALHIVEFLFGQMHCVPIDFMNTFIYHPKNEYFEELDFEHSYFNVTIRNNQLRKQKMLECDGTMMDRIDQVTAMAKIEMLLEAFDDEVLDLAKGMGAISKGTYKPKFKGPRLMDDVVVIGREQSNDGLSLLAVPGNFEGSVRHELVGNAEQLNYLRTGAIPRANVATAVIEEEMQLLEDRLQLQENENDHLDNSRIFGKGLKYELKPSALNRQTFWQARGVDVPNWFPGLITVFQDSFDFKPVLQPSPSAVLLHAWRTMGPRVEIAV